MVLMRLREYWEMENLDFSNFTEININSLGTFLQGLAQDELKKLPEKILLTAIRRLGEQTGLPEDKLKARAYLAVELFKVNLDSFPNHAYFSAHCPRTTTAQFATLEPRRKLDRVNFAKAFGTVTRNRGKNGP